MVIMTILMVIIMGWLTNDQWDNSHGTMSSNTEHWENCGIGGYIMGQLSGIIVE